MLPLSSLTMSFCLINLMEHKFVAGQQHTLLPPLVTLHVPENHMSAIISSPLFQRTDSSHTFPAHGCTKINTELKSPKQPQPPYITCISYQKKGFNRPKSCPVCPRSSDRNPAVQCSSWASQRCQHFSCISQTGRMRFLACPSSQRCYIYAR
jgi:hypothetical protein